MPTDLRPQPNRELSSWRFFGALVFDWGLIAAVLAIGLWTRHWAVWTFVTIVVGSRQHALQVLGHEAVHRLAHRTRGVNDWIGRLFCCAPLGIDLDEYRDFHFLHHRTAGGPDDPEHAARRLKDTTPFHGWNVRSLWKALLFVVYGSPLHALKTLSVLRPRRRRGVLVVVALWSIAIVTATLLHAWTCLGVWWLSMFTVAAAAFRTRELTEHTGIVGTHRVRAGPVASFLAFPHHADHHFEHHRWPSVPFHRLPEARRRVGDVEIVRVGRFLHDLPSLDLTRSRLAARTR
jgi:fatty acid desaturase